MGDVDAGDHFLNFVLLEKLKQLCGVDLTRYYESEVTAHTLWERWEQMMMGLTLSLYVCIQGSRVAEELILGDKNNASNIFCWHRVCLNLPGMTHYDPTLPWVSKIRSNSLLAADVFSYINDLWPTGNTEEEFWKA